MQRCCHWPAGSLLTWPAWSAPTLWSPWETAAAAETTTSTSTLPLKEITHTSLQKFTFSYKVVWTNLFNLIFKTLLQVLVAPDEFVENLKRKTRHVLAVTLSEYLFLGRDFEAFTCAYACMVSMSSCALKRQTSVEVTSSDRVPPGAESHTSCPINLELHMH